MTVPQAGAARLTVDLGIDLVGQTAEAQHHAREALAARKLGQRFRATVIPQGGWWLRAPALVRTSDGRLLPNQVGASHDHQTLSPDAAQRLWSCFEAAARVR